jgi:hypothetical protein
MASPADSLTRLQKVAVFLIALGEQKAREVLADVDLKTVEQINSAILKLGPVRPEVKAAVMIEFSDYFYKNKPLSEKLAPPPKRKRSPSQASKSAPPQKKKAGTPPTPSANVETPGEGENEQVDLAATLKKLRERIDPKQIDWGSAGYDFGEGFKGPDAGRR